MRVDSSGRPTELRRLDLDRFFRPSSLLVLGASDTQGKPNAALTRKLRAWAAAKGASVYLVNPNRESVDGEPCYRSVADVPAEAVDVAVILTGDALDAFQVVQAKSPKYAVIFAAGFAEVGAEGSRKQ